MLNSRISTNASTLRFPLQPVATLCCFEHLSEHLCSINISRHELVARRWSRYAAVDNWRYDGSERTFACHIQGSGTWPWRRCILRIKNLPFASVLLVRALELGQHRCQKGRGLRERC